jgi:hypothetical protein
MPTFLTTRRMSPELARRVQESVSGRRVGSATRALPQLVSVLRVAAALAVIAAAALVIRNKSRASAQVTRQREGLLARVQAETADVTQQQLGLARRVESLVADAAGPYAGDWVADELKGEEAFSAALRRQMVYVRGPLDQLRTSPGFKGSAAESFKDAFSWCLLDPPASRAERTLANKARAALSQRGAASSSVERIQAALISVPLLQPEWQARVRAADAAELTRLAATFDKAPIVAAKRAMKAELLLLVIDEPGDTRSPTELDGERAHWARVQLVELSSADVRLRLRLRVDPSWISPPVRAEHARGIDSCSLSLDVRARVGASPAGHATENTPGSGAPH